MSDLKGTFYGDLVSKIKKMVGTNTLTAQFSKTISYYKRIGYNACDLYCDRLHDLWIQSRLKTLLSSLIARLRVGPEKNVRPYLGPDSLPL